MTLTLDPAAQRWRGGDERGRLLSDEEPGFEGGLDGGLLDGGDGGVELGLGVGGDADQPGVAEDAVSGDEVGFLAERQARQGCASRCAAVAGRAGRP